MLSFLQASPPLAMRRWVGHGSIWKVLLGTKKASGVYELGLENVKINSLNSWLSSLGPERSSIPERV